jgi:hypothetical protein
MKSTTHRQIRPDWHRLDTPAGTFFGYSEAEVRGKANAHQNPLADIAREEQERALREGQNQRGIR